MSNDYYMNKKAGIIAKRKLEFDRWNELVSKIFIDDNSKMMDELGVLGYEVTKEDLVVLHDALMSALEMSMDNQESELIDAASIPYSTAFYDDYQKGLRKVCEYNKTYLALLMEGYKVSVELETAPKFEILLALSEN